jgi:hypothetical protein
MFSPMNSTPKRAQARRSRRFTLAIALTGAVCPLLLAALLFPAPHPVAPSRTRTLIVDRATPSTSDLSVADLSVHRAPLESFASTISVPLPLDDSGHAALSPKQQKKLNKLAKNLGKSKNKLNNRNNAVDLWQARLLDAQQDLNDAFFLPEDTKKQIKAKKKAIKQALKRLNRAQARVAKFQILTLQSESLIAAQTAAILELDANWFDPETLQTPTGLTASADTTQVTFDWDMVESATSYTFYWSSAPNVDPATAASISVTSSSASVDGLGQDETIYGAVTASSGTNESALSSETSGTTGVESGDIQISIIPSRTSGVAPLAVFFDSTDTVSSATSRPFHELSYAWNFGDDAAGNWSTTGMSRNMARGPVAAHVFESPGIYVVTMVAQDSGGGLATQDVTITVSDPDVVYTGLNTVCVSRAGDFSGAPAGSLHVTTTSFSQAMSHIATGKRVLLRRGEAWSVSGKTNINIVGPGTIGAFGTGAKPALTASSPVFELSNSTHIFDDWRFMDLAISSGGQHNAFEAEGQARQALFLRCDMTDVKRGVELTAGIIKYWNGNGSPQPFHDANAIVECTVTNSSSHQIYVAGTRLMLMGGTFDTSVSSHVLRLVYVGQGVVSNNHVRGGAANLHELKLHSQDFLAEGITQGKYSEDLVISDNLFESVNTSWSVAIAPESGNWDERIRQVILERNHFVAGTNTQILLDLSTTETTVRNNLFDLTNGKNGSGVKVTRRGIEPSPDQTVIANNTFYRGDGANLTGVELSQDTTNSAVFNNLAYAPLSGNANVLASGGTGTQASNNVLFTSSVFVSPSPSVPSDFRLITGSPAIDGGVIVPGVFYDFELKASPQDGDGNGNPEPDVGAFEFE